MKDFAYDRSACESAGCADIAPVINANDRVTIPINLRLDRNGLLLEARVGIEPTYKGFADLSLTTWVPRLMMKSQ